MKRLVIFAFLLATSAALLRAQNARSPEVLFKAAQHAEEVQGDLKGAIEQYKKVVDAGNRALAAQALVRMADCYQKLGDAESRRIYERVIRDYGDQREAATLAQTRLAETPSGDRKPGNMIFRRVFAGPGADNEGAISADGRYMSFPDWETGDLAVRDLAAGTNHRLTRHETAPGRYRDYAEESSISPDNTQIAYSWFNGTDRYELRLISLQTTTLPQSRRLYDNEDVSWLAPYEWSPDGKWIAVQIQRKDHTGQIGLVSSRDGAIRILKSIDWRGTSRISFSPDGRFIAFDVLAGDKTRSDREVFVLAVDGSREARVVGAPGQNRVMGFAPDGARLLFASDRGGSMGLWSASILDGHPDGSPVLIKQDIAPSSIGITRTGSLYVVVRIGNQDVHVATVDTASGKTLAPPTSVVNSYIGSNMQPDWSPDGKYLAYVSNRDIGHHNAVIVIRTSETGQSHELYPDLDYFGPPRWTPDSRALLVKGTDLKGREGVYRIDAQTGQSSMLASSPGTGNGMPQMSPDGRKLYFWTRTGLAATEDAVYVERDLATEQERVIFRGQMWPFLSPDGQYLAGVTSDDRSGASFLVVIGVATGERRNLLQFSAPQSLMNKVDWTSDSRTLLVAVRESSRSELMMVPISGSAPRKLELAITDLQPLSIRLHPDGRQIAFAAGFNRAELWTLENFLPVLNAKK